MDGEMYRWVDHTGELELEIEAPDERTVFEDAAAALRELMEDDSREADESRELDLAAPDRATLLAEYLSELLFYAETEDFVPVELGRLERDGGRLRATVHGHRGRPPHLVKAVTYHRLRFDRTAEGWHASVVLDV
jgi:SHS2 domain-containing protein